MSRATLYTLAKSDINVRPGQMHVTVVDPVPFSQWDTGGRTATRFVPIRQWRDANGRDSYFAIDDEIQRLADILFDEERQILLSEHRGVLRHAESLVRRIEVFHGLPWFKRVWRAMRSGV